jgi:C1A family cysteine protease
MKQFLVGTILVSLVQITCAFFNLNMNYQNFVKYKIEFEKKYQNSFIEQTAYQNFCKNSEMIKKMNQIQSSYSVGTNNYTDQNIEFFMKSRLNFKMHNTSSIIRYPVLSSSDNVFKNIDWKDRVRSVKNQGNCGSCWAFSTIGALESMIDIQHDIKTELSEQQLVDCSDQNYGCSGGWMHEALFYVQESNGVYPEKDYPYRANENNQCFDKDFEKKILEASKFRVVFVKENCPESLNNALQINPVCIAVDANDYGFMFYKDGIYDRPLEDRTSINHAVLLTSYDSDQGGSWGIKNSWGKSWGKDGYMRIKRRDEHGVAGMNSYCVFPKSI